VDSAAGPGARRKVALADLSDRDLMAAHCAGDAEAFGELFRRHRDRMWAVALRTSGDRELAADAVQDAFIAAFRRADSYRGDAAVTTWLHRIVVNACLDRLRRVKPTVELPEHDLADAHDEHHRVDVRLDVRQALAQLPEGQRLALVLVDMQGLSVAEAAQVLEVAEGTIKSRCARGRAAMATLLGLDRPSGRPPSPEGPGPPSKEPSASP
jgi:RNA polymerase sigma-70 factor, ECF subfamily